VSTTNAPDTTTNPPPDLAAVKARQHAAWSSGDYSIVGTTLQIVGERLCEALDLHAGETVLDVAAGNGNVSLAAARRGCVVTSTDYVPSLLEQGQQRAQGERLTVRFQEADAEALPFESGSFDVVTSSFGVMFTPDQEAAAAELLRVTRPGGRIGLANWTPTGFIGQLFKTLGGFVPPPAGVRSPATWGTADRLAELFARDVKTIQHETRTFAFRYPSPEAWLTLWRAVYGPLHKAFGTLDDAGQTALTDAVLALVHEHNAADDGTMVVHSDYLEAILTKRPATS
jgi:ubiquinone/menaquinone biosynthesis C-methylase UbiE